MKLVKGLLILLLAAPILFVSCSDDDDDDDNGKTNEFTLDGTDYGLNSGIIENYGQWSDDEDYNFDVTLLGSGLTYDATEDEFTGTGSAIYFEMYSASMDDLQAGTYNYDADETGAGGTFDIGMIVIDYDSSTELGTYNYCTAGTVVVAKSGSDYEFTITLTMNGNTVTGYYKGALTELDFEKSVKLEKERRF
jgi:hypothetical protein